MGIEALSNISKGSTSAFESGDVKGPASSVTGQLAQFADLTGKRLETGPKLTIGTTAPSSPEVGDLWIDTN